MGYGRCLQLSDKTITKNRATTTIKFKIISIMEYKDIPDQIRLKGVNEEKDYLDIGYSFMGKNKIIRVDKTLGNEYWEIMGGIVSQWRAFHVAISVEQEEWNKEQARAATKPVTDLFKQLGDYFNLIKK